MKLASLFLSSYDAEAKEWVKSGRSAQTNLNYPDDPLEHFRNNLIPIVQKKLNESNYCYC